MRTLICTYGYRQDKIVKAMRTIEHDELVLVTGEANTSRPEYGRILELAGKLPEGLRQLVR